MNLPAEKFISQEIVYPDSDGLPMSDNTKQLRWIIKIKSGLDILFADAPDIFVAGDLLWYPVEGDPDIRRAPDAMVAFGRPKGDRGSYKQWLENDIAPQVVFEILSPGNAAKEMARKLNFYDLHGVQEYYLYDPEKIKLLGWLRAGKKLREIASPAAGWISPKLGIQFRIAEGDLKVYRPDGRQFLEPVELDRELQRSEQGRAEERRRAEQQQQLAERLAAQLRALGIEPDLR